MSGQAVEHVVRLRRLRATERMQATKARNVAEAHDSAARAITAALEALGDFEDREARR